MSEGWRSVKETPTSCAFSNLVAGAPPSVLEGGSFLDLKP
jgi:hypothetical protein